MTFELTIELVEPGTPHQTIALVAVTQRDDNKKRVAMLAGYFLVPEDVETWVHSTVERMGSVMTEPLPF